MIINSHLDINVNDYDVKVEHRCGLTTVTSFNWSSVRLIKSDTNWGIHFSRNLFLTFNYFVSVTAGGSESPRGHM